MFRYVSQRLLLSIPTIFLVAVLAFFLAKRVPSDVVETTLALQGMDSNHLDYVSKYEKVYHEMGLHLPEFYLSIRPSYAADVLMRDGYERTFVNMMKSNRVRPDYVVKILESTSQMEASRRSKVLSSPSLSALSEQVGEDLRGIVDKAQHDKVAWHYPIIEWHGTDNQFHHWMSNIIKGNLGTSLVDAQPSARKVWSALRWTILMVVLGLVIVALCSLPLGMYMGIHAQGRFDKVVSAILFAIYAIPKFWLATLMIIFFTTKEYGVWTDIFPSVGIWYTSGQSSFLEMLTTSWTKLILPLLMVVSADIAYLSRIVRTSVSEEMDKEYVKTALSKGLSKWKIGLTHILPNSLVPTITILAASIPSAFAGILIIEVIFNIPGVGRLMYDSIRVSDWNIVFPILMMVCVLTVIMFLLADIAIARLNPKIRLS